MDTTKDTVYQGNCHCGSYRFELYLKQPIMVVKCGFLLCSKQGYLWQSLLEASILVSRDDGNMVQYNSTDVKNQFCSKCGSGVLGEHLDGQLHGQKLVNIRMVRGLDSFKAESRTESLEKSSMFSQATSPTLGSCHCGRVKVEVTALVDLKLKEDNCSICTRNAWAGVYASSSRVKLVGTENVTEYQFGRKLMGHPFCTICGVHVYMNVYGPPRSVIDRLPEERKEIIRKNLDLKPVNVRVLEGVELERLNIERSDEGTDGYERVILGLT
ncbi:glutathione-dependent formaldehyde-activating enzyme [Cadophora sp. DSE1049]|nr:glutathione-dependent formaldehyde-activating enzyme [Cadophora sp. DSE1049]